MLNSRNWCEFYIIDHGTTSEEAAGPAGDLLYRWGNPQTYGRGDDEDKVFYQQHDAHWILEEGPAANAGDPCSRCAGLQQRQWKAGRTGSSVDELTLPWDSSTGAYLLPSPSDTQETFRSARTRLDLARKPEYSLPQFQHQRFSETTQWQHLDL